MKKTLSASLLPLLFFIAMLAPGCGSDDSPAPASCEKAVNNYEAALNAYLADIENISKCQTLKGTLNDLVACPGITAAEKKEYQDAVDDIVCD